MYCIVYFFLDNLALHVATLSQNKTEMKQTRYFN
jgi:hypothetical protein